MDTPKALYADLFEAVQGGRLFSDSKTFADAISVFRPGETRLRYQQQRDDPGFDLDFFVREHFIRPELQSTNIHQQSPAVSGVDLPQHIEQMWSRLRRVDQTTPGTSSKIVLPFPYVVPGGRFDELYYWDSFFTMLGLVADGRIADVRHMLDNFAWLIDRFGFVPNSSRTYHLSRSQPPFFVLMVELLATATSDPGIYLSYRDALAAEYDFWMDVSGTAGRRSVKVGSAWLNRYWDSDDDPREESYAEDLHVAQLAGGNSPGLYRDIRAACESGWDFSSRWCADGQSLTTLRTTSLLPIDLNALLYKLESTLGQIFLSDGNTERAGFYQQRAEHRKQALQSEFFDPQQGFFVDLEWPSLQPSPRLTLAATFPLCFGIATPEQAGQVATLLERDFLQPGGWRTSCLNSGQQWDAPNGWAPLQWITYIGCKNYKHDKLAIKIRDAWLRTCDSVFQNTGKMMEKYNVLGSGDPGGGGEYPNQDGFGWTNGVYLAMKKSAESNK